MRFRPHETDAFLEIFTANEKAIRQFPGCDHLELLHEPGTATYTTLSYWQSESDLQAYRESALFKGVWLQVKPLFAARTEARTFLQVRHLP